MTSLITDIFITFLILVSFTLAVNVKDNFTNKIIEVKREGELLKKNGEAIAREKYFMSKKGEDVFIISEE